jgi:elongation factor Tu
MNDEVEIVGIRRDKEKSVVTGIEMFRKTLDEAEAGDNIGALLRGIDRDRSKVDRSLLSPAQLHAIRNSQLRFTY